jgi:hypothetical protein
MELDENEIAAQRAVSQLLAAEGAECDPQRSSRLKGLPK